jgi:prepilin-type N-terminal cleavage/methylation domain-containing protein
VRTPGKSLKRAFTLVEVILAILIISAIITVLLFFYQRSVEVRQTILREAEYLSISRMFLEQVSGELRTARVVEDQFVGFEGSSNALSFVCTTLPQSPRWIVSTNDMVSLPPVTDLKRVTYRLLIGTNALDIRGVDRFEELLTGAAFTAGTNSTEFVSTNVVAESETNLFNTNDVELIRQPLTSHIKRLQFRYWAGTNWVESWSGLELPGGVEISIGRDPLSADTVPQPVEDESPEVFRRVVYLPNSIPAANKVVHQELNEPF